MPSVFDAPDSPEGAGASADHDSTDDADNRLRIADAEREAAIAALSRQFSEGRLTPDEFSERCAAVGAALTRADLKPIFVDLPVNAAGFTITDPVVSDALQRQGAITAGFIAEGSTSSRERGGVAARRWFEFNRRLKGTAIGLAAAIAVGVLWWGLADKPPSAPPPRLVGTANLDGQSLTVNGRSDCWESDDGAYLLKAASYAHDGTWVDKPSIHVALYPGSLSVEWISVASKDGSYYFELPEGGADASKSDKTYRVSGDLTDSTSNKAMQVDVSITCP